MGYPILVRCLLMPSKPKAIREIFSHKYVKDNGDIVDIMVEQVEKNEQYPEGVKYSLNYISNGKSILRYDNHAGHPHHKHIGDKRKPYEFKDEWQLMSDFEEDLRKLGRQTW